MGLVEAGSRCLVTGGAGFIGSHLVEALVARGLRVRVLDNLMTGHLANLAEVAGQIEWIEGDIRDREVVARACEGVRVIFHEAAIPSVPRSVDEPRLNHEVNVDGTFNLLMAARHAGVRRFVYAASSSAYGEIGAGAKHESQLPQPLSPYAVAKLVGEYYCQVFTHVYGLETVGLRYFNVFGPRQDPSSAYSGVISRFVSALLAGHPPVIFGDGGQSRDFTYVENVVRANLLAAESAAAVGETINVGTGESTTLLQLADELQRIIGTNLTPRHEPARTGDVRHSLADLARAESLLGYRSQVGITEGLRRTVEWYRH